MHEASQRQMEEPRILSSELASGEEDQAIHAEAKGAGEISVDPVDVLQLAEELHDQQRSHRRSVSAGVLPNLEWDLLTGFKDVGLEREYRHFTLPAQYTTMAMSGVGAGSTALILLTTEPYDSPAFPLWRLFHLFLMIGAVIVFLTDLILKVLTRQGRITPLQYSWWHAWLRSALVWMGIVSNLNSTVEHWLCVEAPDPQLRKRCFSTIESGNVSYVFFCAVLHLPFLNYIFMLVLAPLGETVIGQIPLLRGGQPPEERWTRPAVVTGLACMTFPVLLWTEVESRNRFINLKHLESKKAFNLMRKQQLAVGLRSLCDPSHLPLLLAGQNIQHESSDAGVLISLVNGFAYWRQQQLPVSALKLIGLTWDLVESKRADLEKSASVRIERLWSKGDSMALAVGISKPATEEQLKALLRFATWQHFLTSIIAKRRVGPPFAFRFGLGRGACYAVIIPGSTITRLFFGPAVEKAKTLLSEVSPGVVSRASLFPPAQAPSSDDSPLAELVAPLPANSSSKVSNPGSLFSAPSLGNVVSSPRNEAHFDTPPNSELTEVDSNRTRNSSQTTTVASASNSRWLTYILRQVLCGTISPEMDAFLNHTALQRVHLVSASKLLISVTLAAMTLAEGSWTVASTSLLLLVACLTQLTPHVILSCFPHRARLGVPLVANLSTAMICFAVFLANESVVNRNPDWLSIIFALTALVVSDGIAPPSAIAVTVGWYILYVFLTALLPIGAGRHELKDLLWFVVVGFAFTVLTLDRLVKSRRSFSEMEQLRQVAQKASAVTESHGDLLKMLIPPHIVPMVQQLRASPEAVVFVKPAHDVAMLFVTISPALNILAGEVKNHYLSVFDVVNSATKQFPDLSIIFTDGDTLSIGGPLKPPQVALEELPAGSQCANMPLQVKYEKAATVVTAALIELLGRLVRIESAHRLTGVLHRGEALSMVYGEAHPTFALHTAAVEVAELTLGALVSGQLCATPEFITPLCPRAVGHGLSLGQGPELEYDPDDLRKAEDLFRQGGGLKFHPQPVSYACRGVGLRRIFFLREELENSHWLAKGAHRMECPAAAALS
jgi:hypothetical protein